MALLAPRTRDGQTSYSPLWKVGPAVLLFLFLAYHQAEKAAGEEDTARRQEATFGNVLDCKPGGKRGQYCHYVFHTPDEQSYVGWSWASPDIAVNQTVDVYYDAQNPEVSALESFSVKVQDDRTWVYVSLLIAAASIGMGFYAKTNLHADRRSS